VDTYIAEIDGKKFKVTAATVEQIPGQGRVTFYDENKGVVASWTGSSITVYKESAVEAL